MLAVYARVLRIPGAMAFSAASFIGRLPIAMISLSIVLLETARGVSYATAGAVSAAFSVAAAVGGPVVSGFIDRHGQRRVLVWAVALYCLFMVALLVSLDRHLPLPVVLLLAACAGLSMPSVGSLVRTRWAYVCESDAELHVAYAWESVLDEAIFVVGPPLATVLALQVAPEAGLIACILLVVVGMVLLGPQRATEPPPHGRARRTGKPAVLYPGMAALTAVFVLLGGLFGSFELATVAFAQEQGAASATGLLLALYAISSLIAGVVYGSRPPPPLHTRRMVYLLSVMAVVSLGLPLSTNLIVLGVVTFLAGLAVSPVLISGTALVERIVPPSQLTEGITWTITGMALGLAVSVPIAGFLIDARGAQTAYLVTAGCAVTASLLGWAGYAGTRRAEERALQDLADGTESA